MYECLRIIEKNVNNNFYSLILTFLLKSLIIFLFIQYNSLGILI